MCGMKDSREGLAWGWGQTGRLAMPALAHAPLPSALERCWRQAPSGCRLALVLHAALSRGLIFQGETVCKNKADSSVCTTKIVISWCFSKH